MLFVHNPEFFNSIIANVYVDNSNDNTDNTSEINFNNQKLDNIYANFCVKYLVYLYYDYNYDIWIIYYSNNIVSDMQNIDVLEHCLNKNNTYLASFDVTTQKFIIYQSYYNDGHIENYPSDVLNKNIYDYSDICMLNPYGGLIHINSSYFMDFLFSKYDINIAFFHFKHNLLQKIDNIKNVNCPDSYINLCNKFNEYDPEYFDKQIEIFNLLSKNYLSNLDQIDCLSIFLHNFKRSIMHELITIYYRIILYPHEKEKIMYICQIDNIIDKIHERYQIVKKILVWNDIEDIFYDNIHGHNGIINYLTNRISCMDILYDVYLETKLKKIKPIKIKKIKCNHFPFKVFSSELFIVCNMLRFI